MTREQLKWWLLFNISILIGILSYHYGWFHHINDKDMTKLSFVIIILYYGAISYLGLLIYDKVKIGGDMLWYFTDLFMALGMIGTVAGFIIMLSSGFVDINIDDTATVKTALIQMAIGMSTALYTTLVGLICSQLLKFHLISVEGSE